MHAFVLAIITDKHHREDEDCVRVRTGKWGRDPGRRWAERERVRKKVGEGA